MIEKTPAATLKDLTLVLMAVNVHQPIREGDLASVVAGDLAADECQRIVDLLIEKGHLKRYQGDTLRATWAGMNWFWAEPLRKNRDVLRMWYLSNG